MNERETQLRQEAHRLLEELDRLEQELDRISPYSRPATERENRAKFQLYVEIAKVAQAYSAVWEYGPVPKYQCPCCGLFTMAEEPPGTYNICRVCWWEDDPLQFDHPDYAGGANDESLNEARAAFQQKGITGPYWILGAQ